MQSFFGIKVWNLSRNREFALGTEIKSKFAYAERITKDNEIFISKSNIWCNNFHLTTQLKNQIIFKVQHELFHGEDNRECIMQLPKQLCDSSGPN